MKEKNVKVLIIVSIAIIGISIIGGTYAYLTMGVNVTNGTYNNVGTYCLDINYSINNVDNSQDITGTLFPSGTINKGLNGRVGIKTASGCAPTAKGLLKLHVDRSTSEELTKTTFSYCESRSTLEPLYEYGTEVECTTAGGRWRGYGDNYCENPNTLERMPDYTTESDCNSHNGSWTTPESPLKYAVFDSAEANATPVSVGRIEETDIGKDIAIYNNFTITSTQTYYYIYIWLDGYLTDNTYTSLPFGGTINAEAGLTELEPPSPYTYTVNIYDSSKPNNNAIILGQLMPEGITTYNTPASAMAALKAARGGTEDYPFFFRHVLDDDDIVTESYVGFVITSSMAQTYQGLTPGTYYLKAGDSTAYNDNKEILLNAFGSANCSETSNYYSCSVFRLAASAGTLGNVGAGDDRASMTICEVNYQGYAYCHS